MGFEQRAPSAMRLRQVVRKILGTNRFVQFSAVFEVLGTTPESSYHLTKSPNSRARHGEGHHFIWLNSMYVAPYGIIHSNASVPVCYLDYALIIRVSYRKVVLHKRPWRKVRLKRHRIVFRIEIRETPITAADHLTLSFGPPWLGARSLRHHQLPAGGWDCVCLHSSPALASSQAVIRA